MQLIDTHVHLDMSHFDDDREEVIARAKAAGVSPLITIGVTLETSRAAVQLADAHGEVYAAVGIHPHDARNWDRETPFVLRDIAAHPKVVAIGEIGLDYYRDFSPRDVQRRVFRQQLDLAGELGKPVIVHDREAHDDTLRILEAWTGERTTNASLGTLHCFSGDRRMAEQVIALGFYLGFDGPVTYKNARGLREMIGNLPVERLLVETDAPFLAPHPYRGKRNEPAYVPLIAEAIAAARGMAITALAEQMTANACSLFRLPLHQ
jgi:TatD DNase family protein